MRFTSLLLTILIFLSGCVSVKLNEELKPISHGKIDFKKPDLPFEKVEMDSADEAWQNKKTGNSISFLSDCKGTDLPLRSIRSNLLSGLEDLKISEETVVPYNDREGLESVVTGKSEGIPVKLKILVFAKNSCTFSLTFVALKEKYEHDVSMFDRFAKDFKVHD